MRVFLLILVIISVALACEPSEDGCTDLRAQNFNVRAVTSCDSCCEYPKVNFKINFMNDTSEFKFRVDTLFLGIDTIQVMDFELAFHDFHFYENGITYEVLDTVRDISPRDTDDYVNIKDNIVTENLGCTDYVIDMDSLSLYCGLDRGKVEAYRPFSGIHSSAALSDVVDDLYVDTTDVLFVGRIDVMLADSLRKIELDSLLNPEIGFPYEFSLQEGMPWTIELELDMKKVVTGLSAHQTNEEVKETIQQNLSSAIERN